MLVRVGDIQLFFEVFGQEWVAEHAGMRRRTVLLGLHGGPGIDATLLRHQLAPLADVAQVIVPDQRGHGRSDAGTPATWNLDTWAADVKAFCDALGIEHPVVLGSSFGGFVAQRYAAMFPAHPAGLILVSSAPRFASLEETAARFREVGGEVAADAVRRDWETPSAETAAEWNRVCLPLCSRRADPVADHLRSMRLTSLEINHHFMPEGKVMDLRPALRAVQCPTLVLIGDADPLIPVHLGREIVEAIPGGLGRLHLVPDASHAIFSDNPDDTYRSVREFIAELSPP